MKTPNSIKITLQSVSKYLAITASVGFLALSGQPALAEKGDLSVSLMYSKPRPGDLPVNNIEVEPKGDKGFGFAIGYEYDPNWTIEFQYLTSEGREAANSIDVEVTGFHLNGVYRTDMAISQPYFFGRLGFGKSDIKFSQPQTVGAKDSDSGLVYGVGAGYMYSENLSFEASYFAEASNYAHILIGLRYQLGRGL